MIGVLGIRILQVFESILIDGLDSLGSALDLLGLHKRRPNSLLGLVDILDVFFSQSPLKSGHLHALADQSFSILRGETSEDRSCSLRGRGVLFLEQLRDVEGVILAEGLLDHVLYIGYNQSGPHARYCAFENRN